MIKTLKIKAVDKYTGEICDVEFFGETVFKERFGEWQNWEDFIPIRSTGLKDKNGREIYEGDLLQHPNGTIAEIKYSDYLAAFVAVYVQNGNIEMDYLDKEIVNKCKIVGNRYEIKHLLEEVNNES